MNQYALSVKACGFASLSSLCRSRDISLRLEGVFQRESPLWLSVSMY